MAKLRVEAAAASGGGRGGGARVVAIVGSAMPSLAKGRRVRCEGEWVLDKKYGAQLKVRAAAWRRVGGVLAARGESLHAPPDAQPAQVTRCDEVAPDSAAGIQAYLAGGCAPPARGAPCAACQAHLSCVPFPPSHSVIAGVGPATAAKLVSAFGDATLQARPAVAAAPQDLIPLALTRAASLPTHRC